MKNLKDRSLRDQGYVERKNSEPWLYSERFSTSSDRSLSHRVAPVYTLNDVYLHFIFQLIYTKTNVIILKWEDGERGKHASGKALQKSTSLFLHLYISVR